MPVVVGIRFRSAGKVYYVAPADDDDDLKTGDWAIVKTARGYEMGEVVLAPHEVSETEITGELKRVQRRATGCDAMEKRRCQLRAEEDLKRCRAKVAEYDLPMKIVHAEYSLDGRRLVFFFCAEKRVDFRDLVKDLAKVFRTRIELRQIGVRDAARLMGGVGRCGRTLCCSTWLSDFSPVSIKMAKQQGLPLSPMEISGLCGRLLCCLAYEHKYYVEMKTKLPKRGKGVNTPHGRGVVRTVNVLRESVTVELEGGVTVEATAQELEDTERKSREKKAGAEAQEQPEKRGKPPAQERKKQQQKTREKSKAREEERRRRKRRPRGRRPRRQGRGKTRSQDE